LCVFCFFFVFFFNLSLLSSILPFYRHWL
jgi:ABC-type lipoprotein release transport system permease subunit